MEKCIKPNAFGNALGSSLAEANSGELSASDRRNLDYDDPQMVALRAQNPITRSAYQRQPMAALTPEDLAPLNFTNPQELLDELPEVRFADAIGYSSASLKKAAERQWVSTGRFGSGEGHWVDRPSESVIAAQFAKRKFDILNDFKESKAFRNGHIKVTQVGKVYTLSAEVAISGLTSKQYEEFKQDVDGRWKLHFEEKGMTYQTKLTYKHTPKSYKDSDIYVGYGDMVDNRATGDRLSGQITLDLTDLNRLRPGVGAHEFGHSYWGLDDAYYSIKMPNGYQTEQRVAAGLEGYLMGNHTTGTVNVEQLKKMIFHFQSLQQKSEKK